MRETTQTRVADAALRAADLLESSGATADAVVLRMIAERWPKIRHAITEAREYVAQEAEQSTYGSYYGGDPRDFRPDGECSTEEERAAHAADCAAWDAWERDGKQGEPPAPSVRYGHAPILAENVGPDTVAINTAVGHVTFAGYGLGVTTWKDEELCALLDTLDEIVFMTKDEADALAASTPSRESTAE